MSGYRTITKNKLGHKYHHFILHNSKLAEPTDRLPRLSCWCGEVVEEVP